MRFRQAVGICVLVAGAVVGYATRPLGLPAQDGRALEFVARNGEPLGTLLARDSDHAVFVGLDRVAPAFVGAVIAAEDARFFAHGAVDPIAALRAVAGALHGAPLGGASTLTMQLARIVHPVRSGLRGKFVEIVLAQRLENALSKRAILEAYCNRAPMGSNLYGVEAAALTYFGVDAWDLDLAQAALLAALPNDPVRLDPYRHWTALRARQRYVLGRMVASRLIVPAEAARAGAEDVALRPRGSGIHAAPHFLFWLAAQAPADATVVRTTIDLSLQRVVEAQLAGVVRSLADHDVHQAAALVIDNRSGEILAYAGSADYFDERSLGRNDGVQALRQPGSTLKPFLYELALAERAIRPATILLDAPATYAIPGGKLYQPGDYSGRFMGPVRVRIALADSLNVPAVRVLDRVGVPTFLTRLRALGFGYLQRPAGYYGLGLTLGGGEVSLYELARAYATLARDGAAPALTGLAGSAPAASDPPAGDPAWALVTDILADRHARAAAFGVNSVLALPFAAAVKTGTSSDFRDTWTVGFTHDYTVGVWAGNFDGSPMRHVSGVTGAAPLWSRIMLHLYEQHDPAPFAAPRGYVRRPICAQTGERPTQRCRTVVTEWLDRADLAQYASPPRTAARSPRIAITWPHDGDRFALVPGGLPQRIDIDVAPSRRGQQVAVDGRALRRDGDTYLWPLRLGSHEIVARSGRDVARVRISVEPPPHPAHVGFTVLP